MKRLGLISTLVALALGAASPTLAQAPSAQAAPSASAAPDRARLEQQRDRLLQKLRERGLALSAPSSWPLSPSAPSGSAAPLASGLPSALPVSDAAAELKRRWRAHGESRLERRERHRAALVRELGQRLSDPRVKEELKLHATRTAELARIQFLAENARKGAEREKLLARVAKLSAREKARHQRQLARLAAVAAPSASAAVAPAGSGAPR
jgi:hypothetical protein